MLYHMPERRKVACPVERYLRIRHKKAAIRMKIFRITAYDLT